MKEVTYPEGMPVKHCRACTAAKVPAPQREFPYLMALNDVLGFGFDEVEAHLCQEHRSMLDRGQDVLADLMRNYKERMGKQAS